MREWIEWIVHCCQHELWSMWYVSVVVDLSHVLCHAPSPTLDCNVEVGMPSASATSSMVYPELSMLLARLVMMFVMTGFCIGVASFLTSSMSVLLRIACSFVAEIAPAWMACHSRSVISTLCFLAPVRSLASSSARPLIFFFSDG